MRRYSWLILTVAIAALVGGIIWANDRHPNLAWLFLFGVLMLAMILVGDISDRIKQRNRRVSQELQARSRQPRSQQIYGLSPSPRPLWRRQFRRTMEPALAQNFKHRYNAELDPLDTPPEFQSDRRPRLVIGPETTRL